MDEIAYAEQFHLHPQDVRRTVKVGWWTRWKLARMAQLARSAYAHAQAVEDWARDLSDAERAAMQWAREPLGGEQ